MSIATLPVVPAEPDARFRFTIEQFWEMYERGFFDGKRVELVGGEIVAMPAQSNEHFGTIEEVRDVLAGVFGAGFWVRMQGTLNLAPHGVPDPDIAVVPGDRESYRGRGNPTTAFLIVEVSVARLAYDRWTKASLYAAAGIQEYWIVNIPDRQLEIRRNPQPDSTQDFGFGFGSLTTLKPGDTATPLALPNGVVSVERLFY
jgi:Uma2 family endonuclease